MAKTKSALKSAAAAAIMKKRQVQRTVKKHRRRIRWLRRLVKAAEKLL